MRTTKLVVAERVTVNAVVERHVMSARLAVSTTASSPSGLRNGRTAAKAAVPFGSVASTVPALHEGCHRLCNAEDVKEWTAKFLGIGRYAADNCAFGIGDQDREFGVRPRRQRTLERCGRSAGISPEVSSRVVELGGGDIRERLDCSPAPGR